MSPCIPEMDISNAPSAVESPAISANLSSPASAANLSSPASAANLSSPASAHASPQDDGPFKANCTCIHDAEAHLEEGLCSTSSHSGLETARQQACSIHANSDTGLDQQVMEGSPLHHDQGLNEGPHIIDDVNSGQPVVESSGSDMDVEKGWGSSNAKQMDVDEEEPGECCRVCHLTVDRSPSAGEFINLGCACKDDLALAHQRCAETWFKIKGNRTCEICGSTARNILGNRDGDQWNDMEASHSRAERCWQNQPLCNTLVVCVLLVLIASWLFRVTLF